MLISRLPSVICLLLLLGIGSALYLQLKPVISEYRTPQIEDIPATVSPTISKPRHREISKFQLFGNPSSSQKTKEVVPEKLPQTKLRLTLTGVLSGQIESNTGALIEGPDKQTLYYKVGDELPGNASLHKVFPDRIVVKRSGRLENLYFPETSSSGIQSLAEYTPPEDDTPTPQVTPKPAATGSPVSDARKQSIKDRLSNLRKRIINNRN